MTLWIARQYTKLSVRQRIVLLTTLILPSLVIQTLLVHFAPVPLFLVVIVNLVWYMTTATIVASTMNEDTSRMERLVDQNAAQLSDEVLQLREDLEDAKANSRQQVDDLESVMRTAFAELDVAPPPRPISLRGRLTHEALRTSGVHLRVRGGSRMARFRNWMRRAWRRIWEVFYGNPDDG